MTKTERIYALLVEANPVPEPEALPERLVATEPHLTVVDPRRAPMQETTERAVEKPQRRAWIPALGAAAVIIAAVTIGALIFTTIETETAADRESAAIANVEAFYEAINAGDAEAAEALAFPDGSTTRADRHLFEANAVMTATYPWLIGECQVVGADEETVLVDCALTNTDPVYVATGVSELIAPWTVHDDGRLIGRPWQGPNFSIANLAYRDYLRLNHLEEYQAVCSPQAYPGGSVAFSGGVVLTKACAELFVPLAQEVADWVEAGQPGVENL